MDILKSMDSINKFLDDFKRKGAPVDEDFSELKEALAGLIKIKKAREKKDRFLWLSIKRKNGNGKRINSIGRCKEISLDKKALTLKFVLENDKLVNSHVEPVLIKKNCPLKNLDYFMHWDVPEKLERKLKALRRKEKK